MHTTIRNGNLFCTHCGEEHELNMPIPVDDMSRKIKAFDILHKNCLKTWTETVADQSQSIKDKAMWWLANGERGLSSMTMWNCFMAKKRFSVKHPSDPDDFSRAYKLLQAIPEWKAKRYMDKLKGLSIPWKNLVDNWDTLTSMFELNRKDDWKNYKEIGMYELMKRCTSNKL